MASFAAPRAPARTHSRPRACRMAAIGWASHLVHTWRARSRQRRHLEGLNERMLRDIGVSRADVAGESAKPFWRG